MSQYIVGVLTQDLDSREELLSPPWFEKLAILYFRIPHNTLCLPPKFCINHCF